MPIYGYQCSSCGHQKDVLQKISDPVLTTCPECGQEAYSKQVSAPNFQLKGSGWYVTDFRDGNKGGGKDAKSKEGSGSSESGSEPSGGSSEAGTSTAADSSSAAGSASNDKASTADSSKASAGSKSGSDKSASPPSTGSSA